VLKTSRNETSPELEKGRKTASSGAARAARLEEKNNEKREMEKKIAGLNETAGQRAGCCAASRKTAGGEARWRKERKKTKGDSGKKQNF